MKVGKEELAGLLAAVRRYLDLDHAQVMQTYEDQVQYVVNAFSGMPHTCAQRNFPSEAGQPMPRAEIIFDQSIARDEVLAQLWEGTPSISLAAAGENGIYVNPQTLEPGQVEIIVDRLKQIMHQYPE